MENWLKITLIAIVIILVVWWLINFMKVTNKFFDQMELVTMLVNKADDPDSWQEAREEHRKLLKMRIPLRGQMNVAFVTELLNAKYRMIYKDEIRNI